MKRLIIALALVVLVAVGMWLSSPQQSTPVNAGGYGYEVSK